MHLRAVPSQLFREPATDKTCCPRNQCSQPRPPLMTRSLSKCIGSAAANSQGAARLVISLPPPIGGMHAFTAPAYVASASPMFSLPPAPGWCSALSSCSARSSPCPWPFTAGGWPGLACEGRPPHTPGSLVCSRWASAARSLPLSRAAMPRGKRRKTAAMSPPPFTEGQRWPPCWCCLLAAQD
jgi:hypothetical protein